MSDKLSTELQKVALVHFFTRLTHTKIYSSEKNDLKYNHFYSEFITKYIDELRKKAPGKVSNSHGNPVDSHYPLTKENHTRNLKYIKGLKLTNIATINLMYESLPKEFLKYFTESGITRKDNPVEYSDFLLTISEAKEAKAYADAQVAINYSPGKTPSALIFPHLNSPAGSPATGSPSAGSPVKGGKRFHAKKSRRIHVKPRHRATRNLRN